MNMIATTRIGILLALATMQVFAQTRVASIVLQPPEGTALTIPEFGNLCPEKEITVEFWQKITDPVHASGHTVAGDLFCSESRCYLGFVIHTPWPETQNIHWEIGNEEGDGVRHNIFGDGRLLGSDWVHLAFTSSFQENRMRIYINGELHAEKDRAGFLPKSQWDLGIGQFSVQLGEFRIWNYSRSPDEIRHFYRARATGTEAGLILCLPLNGGESTVAPDISSSGLNGVIEPTFWTTAADFPVLSGPADFDGDGLTDSEENERRRFRLVEDLVTWEQARIAAEAMGCFLATFASEEEWELMSASLGSQLANKSFWLGASDASVAGEWEWITGEPFVFSRWGPGEPNNNFGREDWLVASTEIWNDGSSDGRDYYLVEDPRASDPRKADTDSDGLSDQLEVQVYHTFPGLADSDRDGLSDATEVNTGSDPLSSDSDGDGLSDLQELTIYGTNPISRDTDEDGLGDDFEIGLNRYSIQDAQLTWAQAAQDAESKGGHLATITSSNEWEFVVRTFGDQLKGLALGASDAGHEGVWEWVTGEPWGFSNWLPGQPDNLGGNQNNLWLPAGYPDLTWDDGLTENDNTSARGYLLEIGYATDPVKKDSDGDGFSDGTEYRSGSNPLQGGNFPAVLVSAYTALEIEFPTRIGTRYQIQTSSDLQNWADLGEPISGTGEPWRKLYSVRGSEKLNYRVEEIQ